VATHRERPVDGAEATSPSASYHSTESPTKAHTARQATRRHVTTQRAPPAPHVPQIPSNPRISLISTRMPQSLRAPWPPHPTPPHHIKRTSNPSRRRSTDANAPPACPQCLRGSWPATAPAPRPAPSCAGASGGHESCCARGCTPASKGNGASGRVKRRRGVKRRRWREQEGGAGGGEEAVSARLATERTRGR